MEGIHLAHPLDPLGKLNLDRIYRVIVGGKFSPEARSMEESWVLEIKDQCQEQNAPILFKQLGEVKKTKAGRVYECFSIKSIQGRDD